MKYVKLYTYFVSSTTIGGALGGSLKLNESVCDDKYMGRFFGGMVGAYVGFLGSAFFPITIPMSIYYFNNIKRN